MDTTYYRETCHKIVQGKLLERYQIKDFSREEYNDLCRRCRKFDVKSIRYREDRGSIEGSRWFFCINIKDKDVFVAYLTPEDLVVDVMLPEHFQVREDVPEEPVVVQTKKRKVKAVSQANDLDNDLKEAGLA